MKKCSFDILINDLLRYRLGQTNMLQLNKIIDQNSYFTIGLIEYKKTYKHFVFKDLNDYVHSDLNIQNTPPYSYSVGGVNHNRFYRKTFSKTLKLDYTNQINMMLLVVLILFIIVLL